MPAFPRSPSAVIVALLSLCVSLFMAPNSPADEPRFPTVDNETAWRLLPPLKSGERSGAVPVWARTLVRSLPTTTAALLELDRAQRVANPLDPRLRAAIRWVAARTNGSRYAEQTALADWLRAGGRAEELESWGMAADRPSDKVRRVRTFAEQMCAAAYEVRDEQVRELLDDFGPADLTAIVLTLAYANFQDRLFISMGLNGEEGGESLAALDVAFDWDAVKQNPLKAPPRDTPPPPDDADQVPARVADQDWKIEQLDELRESLATQKVRAPRIPIPPDDVVERNLPAGVHPPGAGSKIKWNGVGYGYQPKLTDAWFSAMRRFREEAALPADMRQSAFWVVTRSNWCFY